MLYPRVILEIRKKKKRKSWGVYEMYILCPLAHRMGHMVGTLLSLTKHNITQVYHNKGFIAKWKHTIVGGG